MAVREKLVYARSGLSQVFRSTDLDEDLRPGGGRSGREALVEGRRASSTPLLLPIEGT